LNLPLLALELPLLRRNLCLRLRILVLAILHLIADRVSAQRADTTADCRTRQRVADRGADYRAGCRSDTGPDERAFLTGRERFSRASYDRHYRHRHEETLDYRDHISPHEQSSLLREQFPCLLPMMQIYPQTHASLIICGPLFYVLRAAINHIEQ
jgi:hypothetical protein